MGTRLGMRVVKINQQLIIFWFFVFSDTVISEIDTRFATLDHYGLLAIVPAVMVNHSDSWLVKTREACMVYKDDLPSPDQLDSELLLWSEIW